MNTQAKLERISDLKAAILFQENLLNMGAKRLLELNDDYDKLEREYKLLLLQRNRLAEEIVVLTQNLDLYSNL